jgi:hypothetical protein
MENQKELNKRASLEFSFYDIGEIKPILFSAKNLIVPEKLLACVLDGAEPGRLLIWFEQGNKPTELSDDQISELSQILIGRISARLTQQRNEVFVPSVVETLSEKKQALFEKWIKAQRSMVHTGWSFAFTRKDLPVQYIHVLFFSSLRGFA